MDRPDIVTAFGLACLDGGATALRIEGLDNVRAMRQASDAPLIGLVKRDMESSTVRITPLVDDVNDLIACGADIVAFDATDRHRPVAVSELVASVHAAGALAMADCGTYEDGLRAVELKVDLIGTTLAGYLGNEEPQLPDLDLVTALAKISPAIIAEGCYRTPEQAMQAIQAGAHAVVVGSAITRTEHVTNWFANAVASAASTRST